MEKATKIKVVAIAMVLFMLVLILGMTNVSNAYSITGELTSSGNLKAGQQASVTLDFSNIDAADGIMSITVDKIDYDTSVFNTVTSSNFTGSNGWSVSYSTTNQILTLTNDQHITADGPVVTLTLTANNVVTKTESKVYFENIVASAGLTTGDIPVGTKFASIKTAENVIVNPDPDPALTPDPDPIPTPEPVIEEKNTTNTITTPKTNNVVTTTNTAKATNTTKQTTTTAAKANVTTLPKTGIKNGIIIIASIIVAIGLVFYGKYRKIIKDMKN